MRFLRYLFVSSLFWMVFVAGYLCRDALGDWLMDAHSGSLWYQVCAVSAALVRVFLTFVLVALVVTVCVFIAFGVIAVLQELWYQFFERRLVAVFTRQRQRHDEELMAAAEDEADDIGAPKESVSARKHARRGRSGANNPPQEPPGKSLLGRLAELDQQAQADRAAELDLDDVEIKVTILDKK